MTLEIHLLMQDADHFNPICHEPKEQHVCGGGIFPITGPKMIAGAASIRIIGHCFDGAMQSEDITIGLVLSPAVSGVVQISSRSSRARGERT
jgi:hypothetical protein